MVSYCMYVPVAADNELEAISFIYLGIVQALAHVVNIFDCSPPTYI